MTYFYEIRKFYHYSNDEGSRTYETKEPVEDFYSINAEQPSEYIERMKDAGYICFEIEDNHVSFTKETSRSYDNDGFVSIYYEELHTYFYEPVKAYGELSNDLHEYS